MRWILTALGLLLFSFLPGCVSYPGTPVTSEMTSDNFLQTFMKKRCDYGWDEKDQQSEASRKSCSEKWSVEFGKTLQLQYPGVVIEELVKKCETFSRTCDPGNLEKWAQDSQADHQKGDNASTSGKIPTPSKTPIN